MANRISGIKTYVDQNQSMDDEDATALINRFFAQTEMKTELR